MSEKLSFLTSTRFWAFVIIAILGVLSKEGVISNDIVVAIDTILGGYIGVRTADKFSNVIK